MQVTELPKSMNNNKNKRIFQLIKDKNHTYMLQHLYHIREILFLIIPRISLSKITVIYSDICFYFIFFVISDSLYIECWDRWGYIFQVKKNQLKSWDMNKSVCVSFQLYPSTVLVNNLLKFVKFLKKTKKMGQIFSFLRPINGRKFGHLKNLAPPG